MSVSIGISMKGGNHTTTGEWTFWRCWVYRKNRLLASCVCGNIFIFEGHGEKNSLLKWQYAKVNNFWRNTAICIHTVHVHPREFPEGNIKGWLGENYHKNYCRNTENVQSIRKCPLIHILQIDIVEIVQSKSVWAFNNWLTSIQIRFWTHCVHLQMFLLKLLEFTVKIGAIN